MSIVRRACVCFFVNIKNSKVRKVTCQRASDSQGLEWESKRVQMKNERDEWRKNKHVFILFLEYCFVRVLLVISASFFCSLVLFFFLTLCWTVRSLVHRTFFLLVYGKDRKKKRLPEVCVRRFMSTNVEECYSRWYYKFTYVMVVCPLFNFAYLVFHSGTHVETHLSTH